MGPGGFGSPGGNAAARPGRRRPARKGRRACRGSAGGEPPRRSRAARRLRRTEPAPHADFRAGRVPAAARRLHARLLPRPGIHAAFPTGVAGLQLRPAAIPRAGQLPVAQRPTWERSAFRACRAPRLPTARPRTRAAPISGSVWSRPSTSPTRCAFTPRSTFWTTPSSVSTPDSLVGIEGYNRPPADGSTTYPATPTSLPGSAPVGFLSTTQDPPTVGQNGFLSSIRAKRAWAEVDGEFGSIRFGRMPWHWGRGIFYNDGNCPDCDVGTTVDRVMGLTTVYGHQFAARLGSGRPGTHHPAADVGTKRSERLSVRPRSERRRPRADGLDHPDRQRHRAARAHRPRRHGRQLRRPVRLPKPGQHRSGAEHGHRDDR